MTIRRAVGADLDLLVPLFEAYRRFYLVAPDPEGSRTFLRQRLSMKDSILLLAFQEDEAVGFAQLYPSFSSVRAARVFVLNDLYVAPAGRGHGVATALLQQSATTARQAGALMLTLSTGHDNLSAQALYESRGWTRNEAFRTYELDLSVVSSVA